MRFTDYAKNGILNHYFGYPSGSAWTNQNVSKMTAALFSADPTSSGSFSAEITGLGREDISFGSVSNHVITNNQSITFSTSGWSTPNTVATHLAIIDDDTAGNNMISYAPLTNSIIVDSSKDIKIDIDALAVGFDTNSLTATVATDYAFPDAIVDEILGFVYKLSTIPSQPTGWNLSLHNQESLTGNSHEWSGSGYSRQSVSWNAVSAGSGSFREVTSNGQITLPNQTDTPAAMWGIWDQSNSKLLAIHDTDPDKTVNTSDTVSFADQSIKISID